VRVARAIRIGRPPLTPLELMTTRDPLGGGGEAADQREKRGYLR